MNRIRAFRHEYGITSWSIITAAIWVGGLVWFVAEVIA